MDYGEIIGKAWKIIWKHKVLWIFGILAGLGQGGGGNSSGGGNNSFSTQGGTSPMDAIPPEWTAAFERAGDFFTGIPWWAWILFGLGMLLIIIVMVFLSTIGQAGLVRGAQLADDSDDKIKFASLWHQSTRFFWRLFWFGMLTGLAILVVVILFMVPVILGAVSISESAGGVDDMRILGVVIIAAIGFCCLLIPLMVIVGIIIRQATIAIVIDDVGILEGLKRGWRISWKNPGPMVILTIIQAVISGVVGFVISLPLVLAVVPVMVPFLSGKTESLSTAAMLSLGLCCVYLPVLYLLNGILTSYVSTLWTLAYIHLSRKMPPENASAPLKVLPEIPPPA